MLDINILITMSHKDGFRRRGRDEEVEEDGMDRGTGQTGASEFCLQERRQDRKNKHIYYLV